MSLMTRKHRETAIVMAAGLIVIVALNVMMLFYHYDLWTNPKVGFWTAFWNKFEVSGFDSYTYIIISKWRPLYALSRHPLLAAMVWPLSELNMWLRDVTGINCAIHIVAVVWSVASLCSWMLMYRIMRRVVGISMADSLLLTFFFFSFSHVMLTIFTPDHMTLSLPLLLLAVYLAARAIQRGNVPRLWQMLLLTLVATGVTTTNCLKVYLADIFATWRRKSVKAIMMRTLAYAIPMALIAAAYIYQDRTTQVEEKRYTEEIIAKRSQRDSVFAETIERSKAATEVIRDKQLIGLSIVTNTEYHIDRLPSLTENVFGEGLILHEEFTLKDANRHRPVLVRYTNPFNYVVEALVVILFVAGVWYGRRERLVWMVMSMFLFDMLLHVGLNFASADVYIMTAHWAFAIPVAVAVMMRSLKGRRQTAVRLAVFFLTIYMWVHNVWLTALHIVH